MVLASNLEQILPFGATLEQSIGLEHIASTKKSTILQKTLIHATFLNVCQFIFNFFKLKIAKSPAIFLDRC